MLLDGVPGQAAAAGAEGLFLENTAQSDALIAGSEGNPAWAATGFGHSPEAGTQDDYDELFKEAKRAGLMIGGEILPASTGMGPDFILGTLGVRDYPGLYVMAELSPLSWKELPEIPDGGIATLSPHQAEELALKNILPPALEQDLNKLTQDSVGWGVTSARTGVDGMVRRWAFRWHARPFLPVLNWQDPSGAARRVMEASIIQQVGLLKQSLAGIRAGAWAGLSARGAKEKHNALEPALAALRELSASAHRYGASLLVHEPFPLEYLPALAEAGVDFICDSRLPQALDESIKSQSALPVREVLNVFFRTGADPARLWHTAGYGRQKRLRLAVLCCIPGLIMLSNEDLADDRHDAELSPPAGKNGVLHNSELKKLAAIRTQFDLPRARLCHLSDDAPPNILHFATDLPDGRTLLFTGSFSGTGSSNLDSIGSAPGCKPVLSGEEAGSAWGWRIQVCPPHS